jgi:hypothetical protein
LNFSVWKNDGQSVLWVSRVRRDEGNPEDMYGFTRKYQEGKWENRSKRIIRRLCRRWFG